MNNTLLPWHQIPIFIFEDNAHDLEIYLDAYLKDGYDINVDLNGTTMLHLAASYNKIKILNMLFNKSYAKDIDTNIRDWYNRTPLHDAVINDNQEIAVLLIKHGANVHSVDKGGYTPLHDALKFGRMYLSKLLLNKGANIDYEQRPLSFTYRDLLKRRTDEISKLLQSYPIVIPLVGLCIQCINENNIDKLWLPPTLFKFPKLLSKEDWKSIIEI